MPWTAKSDDGEVLPIPTFPNRSTIKTVLVAVRVEVEMTKSGARLPEEMLETESRPQGEVVPTPTLPEEERLVNDPEVPVRAP